MMKPQQIVDRALQGAGDDPMVVLVDHADQVNLRWANSTLTTNGHLHGQTVDIIACHRDRDGTHTATVSGQVADTADVDHLVARARATAQTAAVATDAAELPQPAAPIVPDWDDETPRTGPAEIAELAMDLGEVFRAGAARDTYYFGYAEHDVTTTYLGSTTGSRLRWTQHSSRLETTARDRAGDRSAWHGEAGDSLRSVDLTAVADTLATQLAWQQRQVTVPPGRHTVLLSPSAVADLMVELYWYADAESAAEGRSVFSGSNRGTRVGDTLGEGITLASDPYHPDPSMRCADFVAVAGGSATTSVFDNGGPLPATEWIADGVLNRLITTRASAATTGLPYAPAVDNLRMATANGQGDLMEVAARLNNGLLITCLWYNRVVDPETLLLTGLTRDGVYLVQDGEVVGSCGNYRFNESPVGLLRRIVDSGTPERTLARELGDYFARATMPPLVVADYNLSTSSDAR
jgi:predicted Zn-dependent protease